MTYYIILMDGTIVDTDQEWTGGAYAFPTYEEARAAALPYVLAQLSDAEYEYDRLLQLANMYDRR